MKRQLAIVSAIAATLAATPVMATGIPVIGELALQTIAEHPSAIGVNDQKIGAERQQATPVRATQPLASEGHWIFDPPVTAEEDEIVRSAMYGCPNAGQRFASPALMLEMLRIEEENGIGPGHDLRGISIATHCREASYMTGDRICRTGSCDGGRAVGPLQLHAGYASLCLGRDYDAPVDGANVDLRGDMRSAIICYVEQIDRVMRQRMRGSCPKTAPWVAEVWIARGSRPVIHRDGRSVLNCGATSSHADVLRSWRAR